MWTDESALDAARQRVDDWESSIAARAGRTGALSRELAGMTATARSDDGTVEATVDSTGALVGLRLDERTRARSADRTAEQVLATSRAAYAKLVRGVVAATEAALGPDDPTARAIVDSYARRLGRAGDGGGPDALR